MICFRKRMGRRRKRTTPTWSSAMSVRTEVNFSAATIVRRHTTYFVSALRFLKFRSGDGTAPDVPWVAFTIVRNWYSIFEIAYVTNSVFAAQCLLLVKGRLISVSYIYIYIWWWCWRWCSLLKLNLQRNIQKNCCVCCSLFVLFVSAVWADERACTKDLDLEVEGAPEDGWWTGPRHAPQSKQKKGSSTTPLLSFKISSRLVMNMLNLMKSLCIFMCWLCWWDHAYSYHLMLIMLMRVCCYLYTNMLIMLMRSYAYANTHMLNMLMRSCIFWFTTRFVLGCRMVHVLNVNAL